MKPVRIQRSRMHKQVSPNGLPIVYVGRPTKWGNPFKIGGTYNIIDLPTNVNVYSDDNCITVYRASIAVDLYEKWLNDQIRLKKLDLSELKGKNLSCWCAIDEWCHADILLELANKEPIESN